MALDEVTDRLHRIAGAFDEAGVAFALVGGQAVALWVATKDPSAVRTTKDVNILLRRADLPAARAAAAAISMDYFEVTGVGMFLERTDPNPRKAVHVLWSGEKNCGPTIRCHRRRWMSARCGRPEYRSSRSPVWRE
jgi:hypothetical protein